MTIKIVIDTDPGIDDAMAILFADRSPDLAIQGLTTVLGNASLELTTRNALYLVERFGMDLPVYAGAQQPLKLPEAAAPEFVHGADGLGNINAPAPRISVGEQTAAEYLSSVTAANPGEITIVALGRLTNLALALQHDSDFSNNVKSVVIMGGALGIGGFGGNVTPCAEANIAGDPHAADIVFRSKLPLTMVGLDVTMKTLITDQYMQMIRDQGGDIGQFIYEITRTYDAFHRDSLNMPAFPVHDASAISYVLQPGLFQTDTGAIRAVTEGIASGQTIFASESASYSPGEWDDIPLKNVCIGVRSERLLELYAATICSS